MHSTSKYYGGHGDLLGGAVVSSTDKLAAKIAKTRKYLGHSANVDDAYQVLRGFRSILPRFNHSQNNANILAEYLDGRDDISTVLHPSLPSHLDHAIWTRDFTGTGGIFSFVLSGRSEEQAVEFLNNLDLFGIGFSYGGYESLAIHCGPQLSRSKSKLDFDGPLIRLACGLEDTQDLINDVVQALDKIG